MATSWSLYAAPMIAEGSGEVVVIVSEGATPGLMVRVYDCVPGVAGGLLASMVNVNGDPVVVVGSPVSSPLALRLNVGGKLPADTDHAYNPMPPVAVSCWL